LPLTILPTDRIRNKLALYHCQGVERRMAHSIAQQAFLAKDEAPVIFFNASTRLGALSYNAAYQQITAWALRLQGIPVLHFACKRGMRPCVLGTYPAEPERFPPCPTCLTQSRALFADANVTWFGYSPDEKLDEKIQGLSLDELLNFEYQEFPLGQLVAPSLRWILRRYHLTDDPATRALCASYIQSAWNIAREFEKVIDVSNPQAMVIFNGSFFPEAVARWTGQQRGLRVITHETAFQHASAFFTDGIATAYPLDPPEHFQLSSAQNTRLDEYLVQRFKGNFSMAGIKFWPEIKGLEGPFVEKINSFSQMVPVFTNVIFDTSQEHANFIFPDMFTWLSQLLEVFRKHPETLFIIRAHPDEDRI
jgi:hypothetical protein